MNERFDIVIAGAGMVGLTIAALLAKSTHAERFNVSVLDAGPEPHFDVAQEPALRVSAISPGSAEILSDAGVWDDILSTRACPYQSMRVWDATGDIDGPETLHFDAADLGVPELGFIVENALIRDRLLRNLAQSGQSVQFNTRILDLHAAGDRYLVSVANRPSLRPELLVAADGSNSGVRNAAGIKVRSWNYSQSALVTQVHCKRHHAYTAWQRFLRSGPLALLPLSDGRVSIVWSTSTDEAERAAVASDEELGRMLTDASDAVLGQLVPGGPRATFPLRAQFAEQYARPGLVLTGDAAHSVHPLAGQGANLGLADAAALVAEIEAALAGGEFPGDLPALRRYERARKGANQLMLRFIDSISRLFAAETRPMASLRSGGMRLFNRSGPIRRQAIQVALGLRR
ncbi:MAG: UbiH/UbiF/VisC/COQ6 family ubiquinone biosynthesis hydroxylase [Gammaproteobacteria bacterium]|nr:UbiH/UbiF/VisC/COQ6 family ubiquinone biosynthesis hydroxylase [Gammaproteobacteria bacterium]MDH4314973.1 UbiH/UbiF/VisC/COQ6 family ubiquinone biosynthesis hydroxylase [Gammaproteobacteria bacterium]MDH5214381.1 UbiH/UbiF/VisC/COQ6 family ubiquinone biosynthesis hydroxylase [Gammaproteobacteria bacterium]MDH5501695.1 UbiH/UbiF/VisC/COQ6 family ubiquinone biosynthesis hydroxylase [Gammaproteobacteria bacterium]